MSEQDDNRKAQSEALGRALAEAMDGDRLHPDNQPQVGTCPTCDSANPEVCNGTGKQNSPHPHGKHGIYCCKDSFHAVPQPTPAESLAIGGIPVRLDSTFAKDEIGIESNGKIVARVKVAAEPRIETVPRECPLCDGTGRVTNELIAEEAGAQPEEREAQAEAVNKIWNQFRSGDGEEDCELYRALEQAYGAGRARAGSFLKPEPSDSDYAIEHGGYLATAAENFLAELYRYQKKESEDGCDVADSDSLNDHAHALRDGIYEFRKRAQRASPPSSPGAAQFVELWEAAQDFYASDSQWKESARDKARAHLGEVLKRTEPSDAMLLEVEKSSPGAPQEQK